MQRRRQASEAFNGKLRSHAVVPHLAHVLAHVPDHLRGVRVLDVHVAAVSQQSHAAVRDDDGVEWLRGAGTDTNTPHPTHTSGAGLIEGQRQGQPLTLTRQWTTLPLSSKCVSAHIAYGKPYLQLSAGPAVEAQ